MKVSKLIMLILMIASMSLFLFMPLMAQDANGDGMSMEQVILYLTPFIVFGVGKLVKLVTPKIPGWAMLSVVGVLSAAVAWVTTWAANPEFSSWEQFFAGLLAVVINEVYRRFGGKT